MRPRLISFRAIETAEPAPAGGADAATLADLLDPVALERRLAVARVRRARALAERRAAREAEAGGGAADARHAPPLVAEPGRAPNRRAALRRAAPPPPGRAPALLALALLLAGSCGARPSPTGSAPSSPPPLPSRPRFRPPWHP